MQQPLSFNSETRREPEFWGITVPVVILLLLALLTYLGSRKGPSEIQQRATEMLNHLHEDQAKGVSPSDIEAIVIQNLEAEEKATFWRKFLEHVSDALFVACFLILAVEIHNRRTERRDRQKELQEITKNVFEGLSHRLLGEGITSELSGIFREDFVKARAGYHITFEGPPDGPGNDWVIVRLESWYEIRNLTGEPAEFPFLSSLLGYNKEQVNVDGKPLQFPHFVAVEFDGKGVPLTEFASDPKSPGSTLNKKFPLPNNTSIKTPFKVVTRLLYKTKDSMVFSSSYVMETSEVTLSNQAPDPVANVEAVVLHKHTEQVTPRTAGKWEFERALLPGQGWFVCWQRSGGGKSLAATAAPANVNNQAAVTITPSEKVTITPSENVTMTPRVIGNPPTA